jgi:PAS domain S-box-containing protein
LLRSILENSNEMMFIHTPKGQILDVNEAAIEELGYTREEMLNLSIFDLDPLASEKKHQEFIWEKDFSIQKTVSIETIHQRKDGSQYPALVNINKIKLGKYEILLAFANNISRSKRYQDQLQTLTNTLYHIVELIPSGFFIYQYQSPDKLFLLHANPEAGKHSREDIASLIGREFDEIWPKVCHSDLKQNLLKALSEKNTYTNPAFSYQDEHTQGVYHIRAFPLPENRLAIAFENKAELKKTEEKLKEKQEILNAFFEYSPIHLFIKDEQNTLIKLSRSIEILLGKPIEMIEKRNMNDLLKFTNTLTKNHIQCMIENDLQVQTSHKCIEIEETIGEKIYKSIKFPICINQNKFYIGGIKIDITPHKQLEASFKNQLEELKRFKKLTIDRELRMIELKKEVNQLLRSQGKEEKYRIIQ